MFHHGLEERFLADLKSKENVKKLIKICGELRKRTNTYIKKTHNSLEQTQKPIQFILPNIKNNTITPSNYTGLLPTIKTNNITQDPETNVNSVTPSRLISPLNKPFSYSTNE